MSLPGTPTLKFEHRYANLVIDTKHDGCITIQKADIPETVAALIRVAHDEGVSLDEIIECCSSAGVEVDFRWSRPMQRR